MLSSLLAGAALMLLILGWLNRQASIEGSPDGCMPMAATLLLVALLLALWLIAD